jgi:ubiquinone/menaquinone biosynthesis C-methylase UbiE
MENKISIQEAYSSEPWWYDFRGFLILTFAYRHTLPAQLKLFGNNMSSSHLEVAVGSGTMLELILKWRKWKHFPEVEITAFDYAVSMLKGAQNRFANNLKIHLYHADAAHLPFENNLFKTANIANAIHCLPEIEKSLSEIYRVMENGGTLAGNCLLEPTGRSFLDLIARKINKWGVKKGILQRPYHLLQVSGFQLMSEKKVGNCFDFIARKS